ncbi:hypothetical protein [uncultured Polaribacter sp.]|uniref:hypothetical protein n=1 Tax=uncultured Polaribacter sp. TaxID=174711 RepID=UPI0026072186|nr:hypothetical protein [uncultured Polaribacter sp.]
MASIKNLKKDINYTLGDIISYVSEKMQGSADRKQGEAVIDETIETFDALIAQVHAKAENKKAHFKQVSADLEAKALALIEKANAL